MRRRGPPMGDPLRRRTRSPASTRTRGLYERRSAPEQVRPQPRALAAHHLAGLSVDERVGAVADETTFSQARRLDLLTPHGLDRKSPQRLDGTDSLTHGGCPLSD